MKASYNRIIPYCSTCKHKKNHGCTLTTPRTATELKISGGTYRQGLIVYKHDHGTTYYCSDWRRDKDREEEL